MAGEVRVSKPVHIDENKLNELYNAVFLLRQRLEPSGPIQIKDGVKLHIRPKEREFYTEALSTILNMFDMLRDRLE